MVGGVTAQVVEAAEQIVDSGLRFGAVLDDGVGVGDLIGFGDPLLERGCGVGDVRGRGGRIEVAVAADLLGGGADVGGVESAAEHFREGSGVGEVFFGPEPFLPSLVEIAGLGELVEDAEVGV